MIGHATISACGAYRYVLTRGGIFGRKVCFVMLNPSTADASADDPTIRKCLGFAARLGCERLSVVNLFALRSTDPRALRSHPEPVGPANDAHVVVEAVLADLVVCAWGTHGALHGRDAAVMALLGRKKIETFALGITKGGHPRHPLYAPYEVPLVPYPAREE